MRPTVTLPFRRAALALACLLLAAGASAQLRTCARLVVVDADLQSVDGGGVIDIDPSLAVDANATVAATGGANSTLSHVAVGPGRQVFVSDLDADPGALGQDANGGPGPGAIFTVDPAVGTLRPLADGSACGSTIVNCGPTGVFVDPVGVAFHEASGLLVVVDPDADPSGLGRDSNGFAGRGAVLTVDLTNGTVDLLADGSAYPPGLPPGQPSIFEDPIAIDFARDGTLYVADQLARMQPGSAPGQLFRVDPATSEVNPIPLPIAFAGLRDVAVEATGTLLVLDRLAGTNGTIYRIDPTNPMSGVLGTFAPNVMVDPVGIVAAGNGDVYLLDAAADPTGVGRSGAIFQFDPTFLAMSVVSSNDEFGFPWGLDLLEPEVVSAITPPSAAQGQSLTLVLDGGTFVDPPVIDLGPDVTVDAVRWIDPTRVEVDVTIALAAMTGQRDVRLTNPDMTMAFHCDLFEVTEAPGCAVAGPIGNSLLVGKREDGEIVTLTWDVEPDPCRAGYRVFRALTPRPTAPPGEFPADPLFLDRTWDDLVGDDTDGVYESPALTGSDEYFLVGAMGTDMALGPVGHYEP